MASFQTKLFTLRCSRRFRGAAGFTLVEIVIASGVGLMLSMALLSLVMITKHAYKNIGAQRRCLSEAKKISESIEKEMRLAKSTFRLENAEGGAVRQSHRVVFSRPGEKFERSFELKSKDDDFQTPWDNWLEYDPNRSLIGNERVVGRWVSPSFSKGIFSLLEPDRLLLTNMRVGDPPGKESVAQTGRRIQALDLDIRVAPRN